jgi:hypothetical protein
MLSLPEDALLPGTNEKLPFFFLADGAFPLLKNLMKPFPGNLDERHRIYNYRFKI